MSVWSDVVLWSSQSKATFGLVGASVVQFSVGSLVVPGQGLELKQRNPQIDGVLTALVAKLEKDKPHVRLGDDDQAVCEQFALTVFSRGNRVDRLGQANKDTAMTFYAASIFFEVRVTSHSNTDGPAEPL